MPRLLLQAGTWFLVLLSAACLATDNHGLPTGVVTYQQVLSRPEAHLYYPGAHAVESHGEGEIQSLLEGNRPAYVQTYLVVSDATQKQVGDWYRAQLTASGWHSDSATEGASISYARDTRESFTIWFFKSAPTGIPWDGKGTLFSIGYQIAPCSQTGVSC